MRPGLVDTLLMSTTIMMMTTLGECNTIMDLSHPLSHTTIYWPGVPTFNRTQIMSGENKDKIWIEVGAFSSGEHGGTHIDVPRHFIPSGFDLNDLPLDRTIADGVVIDVRNESAQNNDYSLTVDKLQQWEKLHGKITSGSAVLINTDWTSRWRDPHLFLNSKNISDPTSFHFPFVSTEAANWLVTQRGMKMLGLDVPGPDGPRDNKYPVHQLLLKNNIIIMENMMIPNTLPARGFRVHAAPIRIVDGTGAPTRIYAMLYGNSQSCTCKTNFSFNISLFLGLIMLFGK